MAKKIKTQKVRSIFNPKVDGKYHPPGEQWDCPEKHLTRLIEDGSVEIITALEDLKEVDPKDMKINQLRDVLEDMKVPMSRHMDKPKLIKLLVMAREAEKAKAAEEAAKAKKDSETEKGKESETGKEKDPEKVQDPEPGKDPEPTKEQGPEPEKEPDNTKEPTKGK